MHNFRWVVVSLLVGGVQFWGRSIVDIGWSDSSPLRGLKGQGFEVDGFGCLV